jgi:hypothetical protein
MLQTLDTRHLNIDILEDTFLSHLELEQINLFHFQTVQKDARADLNIIEKRIRQQETDVERMKDEYHRELLRLRNLIKQKEIIINRLQQEKTYVSSFIQICAHVQIL